LAGRQGFEPRYRGPENRSRGLTRCCPCVFTPFFSPGPRSARSRFLGFLCSVSLCVSPPPIRRSRIMSSVNSTSSTPSTRESEPPIGNRRPQRVRRCCWSADDGAWCQTIKGLTARRRARSERPLHGRLILLCQIDRAVFGQKPRDRPSCRRFQRVQGGRRTENETHEFSNDFNDLTK